MPDCPECAPTDPWFWFWAGFALAGFTLILWTQSALPKGTVMMPIPPRVRTQRGPFRWMRHPGYLGNIVLISGVAGMAAGFWNALAASLMTELLMRYWAWLEDQR